MCVCVCVCVFLLSVTRRFVFEMSGLFSEINGKYIRLLFSSWRKEIKIIVATRTLSLRKKKTEKLQPLEN